MILIIWFVVGAFILCLIDKTSFLFSNVVMINITVSVLMGPIAFAGLCVMWFCTGFAGVLNFIFS